MERAFHVARLVVAMLALGAGTASACINEMKQREAPDAAAKAPGKSDPNVIAQIVEPLEKEHAQNPNLENTNDLGVYRLLDGRHDEAIALFREAEQKYPGNAKVAANLGTALELKGDDEEALKWIREGVNRDASEHQGSEWLHARILTAKVALKTDPKWLLKNHVLDLDFGTSDVPVAPEILPIENGKLKGVEQLLRQIDYQLKERTKFVKPPDAVVSDIYSSAGDLALAGGASILDGGVDDPIRYYEAALKYGAPRAKLVQSRLDRYKADLAANPPPPKPAASSSIEVVDAAPVVNKRFAPKQERSYTLLIWLIAGTVVTLLLVFVGWLVDRHRKKQAELNPPPPLPDVD
jgi:tetratricopeptide (TPR) repeat protein